MKKISNPREAAFLALTSSKDFFIEDFFNLELDLSSKDLRLAKEIAFGTIRRSLSLEYLFKKQFNAKLKRKERLLFYSALYQFYFMDRIPAFALIDETVELAKKYFKKGGLFNALLRRLKKKEELWLPTSCSIEDLSYFYSFPPFFVKELLEQYGEEITKSILKASNTFSAPMVRIRSQERDDRLEIIQTRKFMIGKLKEGVALSDFVCSEAFYVQNISPILLLEELSEGLKKEPERVLDLCASPGGKLIALHDLFPKAKFFGNEISKERFEILKKNLDKYQINATLYLRRAEEFSEDLKFDLIILDVPCSNSGVLSKRHEARWRSFEEITKLQEKQVEILKRASCLLSEGGEIWYLTCSILKKENEDIIEKAKEFQLEKVRQIKILPDQDGRDGAFGVSFRKTSLL